MPCFRPVAAHQAADGKVYFSERSARSHGADLVRNMDLPCGRCIGCRLERSRQWAVRCMHEASMHADNCFVTLTYNLENVPAWFSLEPTHLQKFIRKLRKRVSPIKVRFFACGEYGESGSRPHYHALLFGYNFPDRCVHSSSGENTLYRSPLLESLWVYGFSTIGEVNFTTARYVAAYTVKKINGDLAAKHYAVLDDETGELGSRVPEFGRMSRRPGIGHTWLEKFWTDLHYDHVIVDGRPGKPPRYYDKYFSDKHPERWEEIQFERESNARKNFDGTAERLVVKEEVAHAAYSQRPRKF